MESRLTWTTQDILVGCEIGLYGPGTERKAEKLKQAKLMWTTWQVCPVYVQHRTYLLCSSGTVYHIEIQGHMTSVISDWHAETKGEIKLTHMLQCTTRVL